MDLTPDIAAGEWRPLDPRYVDLQRQVGWITTGVIAALAAIGIVVSFLMVGGSLLALALVAGATAVALALLGWFLQRWPPIEYRYASYRVDPAGLEIRRGVYWRSVITVPRSRVQHTDVSQGPLERRYGLATLAVHTAGTEHARVELSGLPHETALAIRDQLLPRDLVDAI